ncbi:bifunctional 2',3'-cyclic-nucleotide 2'-phosphodiesterase/3'-nucleotidase [Neomegalonema perideroedes]|uniref:bifunctional 2',3'-cyclic-nucleotide 2'-phosphodiesterase/3'-nucleotidase n=1 Tax=Neomegalonema perideroedes TaxID=217219 RepID=UPI00035CBB3E|nr:bifunctional 2',3'-cyclic-nucleotide 2'-phosphodiesterase/3'-nucleotidase [Neomegalonema perideroedes]
MSKTITRRSLLVQGAALSGLAALHPFSARAAAGQAHLRILSTTDIHYHIHAYDYYADKPNDTMGLARTASLIEAARDEARNSILLDNGDYLQGNPLGDFMAYGSASVRQGPHPIAAAMNALGYDAGGLGNHEFNYGLDYLQEVNSGLQHPVFCANFAEAPLATNPLKDRLPWQPYGIFDRWLIDGAGERHVIRIGVIGFVPPQILQWDAKHLANYAARDIVEAARVWVPKLREMGAQIVVALSHSGISLEPHEPGMENASYHLAGVEGIDAIVMGHAHRVWPSKDYEGEGLDQETGKIRGKPAVMAGFWGSHMGLIDLLLEKDGEGWRAIDGSSEARPIFERQADRSIKPLAEDYAPVIDATQEDHEDALEYVRAEVGRTASPLHSYFALVADDPSVQIVNLAQMWYVKDLIQGTENADLPLISAAAPFKAGGRGGPEYYTDVPAGPVALKNVADLYLYPNTLQVVKIPGREVREWLERSAGMFNQVAEEAEDAPLLNPDFPSFNFDAIDGVAYEIDLSQPSRYAADGALADPEARRIVNLTYQGEPIDEDQLFLVATNNYRASGGGKFPGADGSTIVIEAPDANRDVLVRYIHEQGEVKPAADANWRFKAQPGATALFETGPGAAAHLEEVRARGLEIEEAGEGENGFARYRLKL